jgi:hypothetical protein
VIGALELQPVPLNDRCCPLEICFDTVSPRNCRHGYWIKAVSESVHLPKCPFETSWRDNLQYPGWHVTRVPERVPLAARFQYQVADVPVHLLIVEECADLPLKHETVFVFPAMAMQGRSQSARRHEVFNERKPASRVLPVDHESIPHCAEGTQRIAVRWTDNTDTHPASAG